MIRGIIMYPPLVNKINKLSDASPAGIISSIWSNKEKVVIN
jgi:hypothetical protein